MYETVLGLVAALRCLVWRAELDRRYRGKDLHRAWEVLADALIDWGYDTEFVCELGVLEFAGAYREVLAHIERTCWVCDRPHPEPKDVPEYQGDRSYDWENRWEKAIWDWENDRRPCRNVDCAACRGHSTKVQSPDDVNEWYAARKRLHGYGLIDPDPDSPRSQRRRWLEATL